LRDKPATQPGVANHLRKLDDDRSTSDFLNPQSRQFPTQNQQGDGWFAQQFRQFFPQNQQGNSLFGLPNSGNSLPPGISNQLPASLRDLPLNNPAVANYLGGLGLPNNPGGSLISPSTITPSGLSPFQAQPFPAQPFQAQPFQPLRNFLRR
jgi:hypothetical protein